LSTSPETRPQPPRWAKVLIDLSAAAIVLAICAWAARSALQQNRAVAGAAFEAPQAMEPCVLKTAGFLRGRLYGSLDLRVDWSGEEMACDGMMRPDNKGIRLVFASPETSRDRRLVFLIGIDGELDKLARREERANVTIIDEGSGRFFSTSGKDRCWTTIRSIESLDDDGPPSYRVDGDLYCAGALPSLTGKGSVTLGDFHYSGRLSLDES
jgi:hypothetical protein